MKKIYRFKKSYVVFRTYPPAETTADKNLYAHIAKEFLFILPTITQTPTTLDHIESEVRSNPTFFGYFSIPDDESPWSALYDSFINHSNTFSDATS